MSKKLIDICKNEKILYTLSAINTICDYSKGDVRNAINMLQLVFNRYTTIDDDNVLDTCDIPHYVLIKDIFDFIIANDLSNSIKYTLGLLEKGYSREDVLLGMIYTIKSPLLHYVEDKIKIQLYNCITRSSYDISKSCNTNLQLTACIIDMIQTIHNKN
jgi:DNA polymerase III delta prime subunit